MKGKLKYMYVRIKERGMATKRLTIELSTDQYELLRKQASSTGTTVTGFIRKLIDDFRLRPTAEARKHYQSDPLYKVRGSFDGPKDLAENHDHYLYGRPSK
jgi:Tfp pilus assembly protein PilV